MYYKPCILFALNSRYYSTCEVQWFYANIRSSFRVVGTDLYFNSIFGYWRAKVFKMNNEAILAANLLPLIIYFGAVVAITGVMLEGAYLLGQRHHAKAADEPFESGIVPAGDVHIRFSVHFYLLAIFFVIFDMESVFLFAWSVALEEAGWSGYIEALIFISILIATLIYLGAIGALDWRTRRQRTGTSGNKR
jgi:NADH-quinone oxidoreductase subunit A